tara:strand:+ start:161 stop:1252 length:1092 start_codon:yes stop_codon:yes gene_type:complete
MKDYELKTEKWIDFWNLFDKACWSDFLTRNALRKAYKSSEFGLRGYMHDNILVPAIEEIETNLKQLDEQSKFLYWFRFKEELKIVSENYNLDYQSDLDKITSEILKEYEKYLSGIIKELRPEFEIKPEFFKWFYIAICSLKTEAEMFLNEVLFDLPVFNKSELHKRNQEILEKKNKNQIINIYNSGNINSIINSVSSKNDSNDLTNSINDNIGIVLSIIDNFKNQIENNGIKKLLYDGKTKKLRHESTAQLLFFSVAQIYCLANNIDVSPETDSGNGSVDFKFSNGYNNKVNVEIKYSTNPNLKHGLEAQLKKYDEAEGTKNSFYLILKVANNERKINNVIELDSLDKVKVIDARLTTSASKK